jgi:2-iminoacetate synthase
MREAEIVYNRGFRHVLLVSGEKRDRVTLPYLREIVAGLHDRFASISLEIFPLARAEYRELFLCGVDGLTVYQETYDRRVYAGVHPSGPKADYDRRLLTPERAAQAGVYRINIGALLGLAEWFGEAACLGLHAAFLRKHYWQSQIAVSFPRLRQSAAGFQPLSPVSDRRLVQMLCALRIFLPSLGLVVSTRERAELRDNLIFLGATQMSAESRTSPLGYADAAAAGRQFEVADERSLAEVAAAISQKGYEPVLKDWDKTYIGGEK